MNRDEILNMPAGRKMDALIAEKVFGYVRMSYPDEDTWGERYHDNEFPSCESFKQVPSRSYSTDIAAAWEVAEKVRNYIGQFELVAGLEWHCMADHIKPYGSADTAPLAICRAALLAVMDKV